jgi:hypothetical protein
MRKALTLAVGLMLATVGAAGADEPRPVPLTRPEMKQFLEDMKARRPRIPLPELTEDEKAKLGERGSGYESRLRALYMPAGENRGGQGQVARPGGGGAGAGGGAGFNGFGFGRDQDPKMTLDYPFKTELFWIVSRTNNCQYCLGHQESKLLGAGLKEDEIAALDGDWTGFTPAQRAAFAFARKVTYEPHLLSDADIKDLRAYYTDLQILEMTLSVAGNNAINRWKEGVGVPQSPNGGGFGARRTENAGAPPRPAAEVAAHSYLTPTSEKFREAVTRVAPLMFDAKTGDPTRLTVCRRPALEPRAQVEKALESCRQRSPRLPLVPEAEARAVVSSNHPEGPLPQWVRLLANFPRDGVRLVTGIRSAAEKGDLSPLFKARVSWIIARQDRAWYAAGLAKTRLRELGQTDDQVYSLDGDWSGFSPTDRALFTVARKLAASPVVLTDDDVAQAVKLAGPRDVVQLISYTTNRASYDRITEAAGLQLER